VQVIKTNGKKTFGELLCCLIERCNLCLADEKNYTKLSFVQRHQRESSFRPEGAKKKSLNKLGYILRPSAGYYGTIPFESVTPASYYSARNAQLKTTEQHAHNANTLEFNDRMNRVSVQCLQVDK